MTGRWDAVIAGAGPAGSALAILLAEGGARVLLVDAVHFPRDKVCGEFLSADVWPCLRRLGLEQTIRSNASAPMSRVRLCLSRGVQIEASLPLSPSALPVGLSRASLDHLLLRRAESCGVQVALGYRVREVLRQGRRVVGLRASAVTTSADTLEVCAPLIVAADGRRSVVVRQTGHTVVTRRSDVCGVKCHLDLPPGEGPGPCIEMHSLEGGYFGVCEIEDSRVNLCGLLPRRRLRAVRGDVQVAVRRHSARHPQLIHYLDRARCNGAWHTMPEVSQQESHPMLEGVLYVGDARGTIEPLAGQGIAMALQGALLAAEFLGTGRQAVIDSKGQADYNAIWQAAFRPQIARVAWLSDIFSRPVTLASLVALTPMGAMSASALLRLAYRATTAPRRAASR